MNYKVLEIVQCQDLCDFKKTWERVRISKVDDKGRNKNIGRAIT